ncbi:a1942bb3-b0b4-42fa-909b-f55ff22be790 [Thermothielavioides terrestris]|uniref:A1942bb3-b0b4-42fa-909b-f55ff22be790 n=1 Tax=Thermothielavioides terrestris TaxID=2587410 RepID=A0A446B5G8_9PEZI|nr:a1942bb3-b0b4-42fa-909b-f55ff22be790 [Thermothielavioides terrestris]
MHPKRTYFLAPSRDQAPTGAIALGNLIKSPRSPEFPLNDPKSPTVTRLQSTATVISETNATRTLSAKFSVQRSVFASFLQGILGGQDPVHLELLAALFAEPSVQAALRDSRFTANLYLVTAVQIAHGADYVVARARRRGTHVHLAADLLGPSAGTVPAGAGVQADVGGAAHVRSAGTVEGPFVFAYSLREVLYRRKTVTEQRRARVKGDLYGIGEKAVRPVETGDAEYVAELAGLKDEDPELPGQWDLDVESGLDMDGSECQIVRVDIGDGDSGYEDV